MAHFADPEPTSQHEQEHRTVWQGIDHPKERDDLGFRHRPGKPRGDKHLMARELNGRMRQAPVGAQEDKEALQPMAARYDGPWRQVLVEGSRDPGVNILRGSLGQVLIECGLPGRGHQHCFF